MAGRPAATARSGQPAERIRRRAAAAVLPVPEPGTQPRRTGRQPASDRLPTGRQSVLAQPAVPAAARRAEAGQRPAADRQPDRPRPAGLRRFSGAPRRLRHRPVAPAATPARAPHGSARQQHHGLRQRLRPDRRQRAHARAVPDDRQGAAQPGQRAADRRNRHRQGTGGPRHPLLRLAPQQGLRRAELRFAAGKSTGKRAVRLPQRRLHRRRPRSSGPVRCGR
ncbi:hypothetical protein D3C84_85600 [compost metagenome]